MNDFNDLFATKQETEEKRTYRPNTKDDWKQKKQQERTETFAMLNDATADIAKDSGSFRTYLDVQSRFDRYSVGNAILISHQMPDATRLADFSSWKENGASILKGEKAISILEPGNDYVRHDGTTGFSVNVKKVFDVSQTTAADKPEERRVASERDTIKALFAASPVEIRMTEDCNERFSAGYAKGDDAIYIRKGMENNDIFASLSMEIANAKLSREGFEPERTGFVSYCAAYILCTRYGFNTRSFNFDDTPHKLEGMSEKEVRNLLGTVRETANDIGQDMSRELEAMDKARRRADRDAR